MPIFVTQVAEDYADVTARQVKMLLCGPPGAGKTLLASTFPNPLYIDAEGQLLSIRNKIGAKRVRVSSIQQVEEIRNMLDQDVAVRTKTFGGPVDTVVIDTIDEVARLTQQDRLRSERRETFTMQDWGWYGDFLRNLCRSFRNLDGLNVIFNCHLKMTEDGETGKVIYRPDISGSVGNEIASYVDEALLLVPRLTVDPATGDRVSVRVLQTYPDPSHDWVKDHSGVLPPEIPLNFVDDGEQILKRIFGDVSTSPRPPVTVETTDAIAEAADEAVAPPGKRSKRAPQPAATEPAETTAEPAQASDVQEKGTEPGLPVCARCGTPVENRNVAEISEIRFGEVLCPKDFAEARAAEQDLTK